MLALKTLGAVISNTGSSVPDLEDFEAMLTGAFFGNAKILLNKRIPMSARMQKLGSIALGILRSRACSWQPCKATYERLDKLQTKLVGSMLRLRKEPGDTRESYAMKRNGAVGRIAKARWSGHSAQAAVSWAAHLQRHPSLPCADAWKTQNHEWVEEQRTQNSQLNRAGVTSRTLSRGSMGKVYRWDNDGWVTRIAHETSKDAKRLHAAAGRVLDWCKVKRSGDSTGSSFL